MKRVISKRRFGAQTLPKWPDKDKKKWTSLLPSSKATADLTTLETRLSSQGVKYCLPAFVDMHGVPKTKLVPIDHAVSMCEGSELFTGAALDGVPQEVSDNEVCAVADPALGGFPLPYKRDVAWFPASLYLDGKPYEPCSRNIYARAAAAAKDKGYLMKLGIEAEFFVFRQEEPGNVVQLKPVSELKHLEKPCYDSGAKHPNMSPVSYVAASFFCIVCISQNRTSCASHSTSARRLLPDLVRPAYDTGLSSLVILSFRRDLFFYSSAPGQHGMA